MIRHPKRGQAVTIRHAKSKRPFVRYHAHDGVVVTVSNGPGPRNVLVSVLVEGHPLGFCDFKMESVVVPCGNLFPLQQ